LKTLQRVIAVILAAMSLGSLVCGGRDRGKRQGGEKRREKK
jgi:hypothetical protein